jgi:hypothetical protein
MCLACRDPKNLEQLFQGVTQTENEQHNCISLMYQRGGFPKTNGNKISQI